MTKVRRRWGCAQLLAGCSGMLLGIVVTIGGEIYLGALAAKKVSAAIREQEEKGTDPVTYQMMCGNPAALEHSTSLRLSCERQFREMKPAARRRLAEIQAAAKGHPNR